MEKAWSQQSFWASPTAPRFPFPTVIRNGNKTQLLSYGMISVNLQSPEKSQTFLRQ